MIAMDKVVKRYKDVIALDHFSFQAKENELSACSVRTAAAKRQRLTACFPY
ncbi:hypothetical protein [Jeotgalicoccus sp. WY2]|uniref:hypothetical protein n=1 Tax=Jeotgalicoccus sp. WY2 TaxID=2708346 RepID=UPI002021B46E|nr:hypothetical protein [Jeotgalicoccus sp. WY2]